MSAGQRSADEVLRLLGEAKERLDAARAVGLTAGFSAADIEVLIAAEQSLAEVKIDAMELRRALQLTLHNLCSAVREKTGEWPTLPDGAQVRADRDSPRWSFQDADASARFLDAVADALEDLAPAEDVVRWVVARVAEVYPLRTKSIPVTHSGAAAVGVDPTEYRENTPGLQDYKVVQPKTIKGGKG